MLLVSLFYLLQPAYAETTCPTSSHETKDLNQKYVTYKYYDLENNYLFVGCYNDLDYDEALKQAKSNALKEIKKYKDNLEHLKITVIMKVSERTHSETYDGNLTTLIIYINILTTPDEPSQAEIEAERLSKIDYNIELANLRLSQLNSDIAEATIRISELNSDAEYHHPLDDKSMNDNDLFDMNDKRELRNFNKKHKKYNASVLAFGIPMVTAGVICAGIVASEDIRMSSIINQPIKSLYDGHDHYDSNGLQTNWEWSDETKVEHKKLGIAGALLGGTGLIITTLGFAW